MSLQTKIYLILGVAFLALVVGGVMAFQAVVLDGFEDLERKDTIENTQRVVSVLQDDLRQLESITADWGEWDDSYQFIASRKPEFLASTLDTTSLLNNRLNLMVYLDLQGQVVFAKAADLQAQAEAPLPRGLDEHLAPGRLPMTDAGAVKGQSGLIVLSQGPMLVSVWPILTSQRHGPARGSVVFGRFLNAEEVERLSRTTLLSLAIFPVGGTNNLDVQAVLPELQQGGSIVSRPRSDDVVAGYTALSDIYGQPVLVLRTELDREIVKEGKDNFLALSYVRSTGAILILVAIALLMQRLVLRRIRRISLDVQRVGASAGKGVDLSVRLSTEGNDELSRLSQGINAMLGAIEQAQRQRDQAQEALRSSEERFRFLAEQSQDVVYRFRVAEPAGLEYVSPAVERLLGIRPEELYQDLEPLFNAIDPDDQHSYFNDERLRQNSGPVVLRMRHRDGEVKKVEVTMIPVYDEQKELVAVHGAARDVTAREDLLEQVQRRQEQLRELSRRLVEAQEAERRRVALELHDEIGQVLTGLKLLLERADRLPPEAIRKALAQGRELINDLIPRIRDISRDLRPAMLDDLGLVPALESYFKRYTAQSGVEVHFEESGLDDRLGEDVETAVYRIVQEGLTNAARHAAVSEVWVRIHARDGDLAVEIEDHGIGFDSLTLSPLDSSGLTGMRERATLLGGRFAVESQVGRGTRIAVHIPVRAPAPRM